MLAGNGGCFVGGEESNVASLGGRTRRSRERSEGMKCSSRGWESSWTGDMVYETWAAAEDLLVSGGHELSMRSVSMLVFLRPVCME